MNVTTFRREPSLTEAQRKIEAIVKVAADLGMGGFALAKLRSVITAQIESMTEALKPFAAFHEKAEKFVSDRAKDDGSPIMPTTDFRLADFKRAKTAIEK